MYSFTLRIRSNVPHVFHYREIFDRAEDKSLHTYCYELLRTVNVTQLETIYKANELLQSAEV